MTFAGLNLSASCTDFMPALAMGEGEGAAGEGDRLADPGWLDAWSCMLDGAQVAGSGEPSEEPATPDQPPGPPVALFVPTPFVETPAPIPESVGVPQPWPVEQPVAERGLPARGSAPPAPEPESLVVGDGPPGLDLIPPAPQRGLPPAEPRPPGQVLETGAAPLIPVPAEGASALPAPDGEPQARQSSQATPPAEHQSTFPVSATRIYPQVLSQPPLETADGFEPPSAGEARLPAGAAPEPSGRREAGDVEQEPLRAEANRVAAFVPAPELLDKSGGAGAPARGGPPGPPQPNQAVRPGPGGLYNPPEKSAEPVRLMTDAPTAPAEVSPAGRQEAAPATAFALRIVDRKATDQSPVKRVGESRPAAPDEPVLAERKASRQIEGPVQAASRVERVEAHSGEAADGAPLEPPPALWRAPAPARREAQTGAAPQFRPKAPAAPLTPPPASAAPALQAAIDPAAAVRPEGPEAGQQPQPAPAAERPAAVLAEQPPTSPGQAAPREIHFRLAETPRQPAVEVRVKDQAGELRVSVRTPDTNLTQSLREGLPELVDRLRERGFDARVWRPAAAEPAGRAAGLELGGHEADLAGGSPDRHTAQDDPQGKDERQDRRQQETSPRWSEEPTAFSRAWREESERSELAWLRR